MADTEKSTSLFLIPSNIIQEELEGLYGGKIIREMGEIINLYNIYDSGAEFVKDASKDFTNSDLKYKHVRYLINVQARFLFSKSPDITVKCSPKGSEPTEAEKQQQSELQTLVDTVLEKSAFQAGLVKAAKDCLIGKRIAIVTNFSEDNGIQVSFLPSLEFVYDTDPQDKNKLTLFVAFYQTNDKKEKKEQRIYKKRYWLENGKCWFNERIYDGNGETIEEIANDTKTELDHIPAAIVMNEGLTGDMKGESDVALLAPYEEYYSKLANGDMDAERKSMNVTRYMIDLVAGEDENGDPVKLSGGAGAIWDLRSDQNINTPNPNIGMLEPSMAYTGALSSTLNRIKTTMYDMVGVPDITADNLQGVLTSGKTIRALYYPLIVRCDEKFLAWKSAIINTAQTIIEGAKLFPKIAAMYVGNVPNADYTIETVNQYPLPEEESDEKMIDMQEVNSELMSKKAYMQKWRNLTDDEAAVELAQIAREREILEDSYTGMKL